MQSETGHKRAVLYARVSTDEQAKGYSLPTQLEACQKYAESAGYHVAASFKDDYTGTTPIEQRPEGRKAYAMLSSGDADALIVYRMDRLVRPPEEGDEWDIPILIRSLAKLGREIHTVDRGKLESSFVGLLTAVFDGKGAGDERRKIIERAARGRRAKARQGWVGAGTVPLGYARVGTRREARLEIDDAGAQLVRRIFAIYLGEGEERLGLASIAARLNDEGIPTPGGATQWRHPSILAIIRNPIYAGLVRYAGATVNLPELAIITPDVYQRAQEQRATNKNESKRNTQHDYLLRSRLACACGGAMRCETHYSHGKEVRYYYRCWRSKCVRPECDEKMIRADAADSIVWGWLGDLFKNPARLRAGLRKYAERQRELLEPKRRRLDELPRLVAECEGQAAQLAESLKRVKAKLAVKSIEEQLEQVSAAHRRYLAERERLTAELKSEEMGDAEQKQIMAWAAEIREGIDAGDVDFETKRQLCERLKVHAKIEYQDGERGLRLTCALSYADKWVSVFGDNASKLLVKHARSRRARKVVSQRSEASLA
jgi:site-specific DNA recombinase